MTKNMFPDRNCLSIFFSGVEKSKVANRLKRVLPKFRADRSHVRGVNGRSKFDVASDVVSSIFFEELPFFEDLA